MTKYRLQAVLFVMVAFMLGCNEYMIVGVLPDIKGEFGTPLATLGYLVTVFAGVYALLTPVLTTIASRFRRYDILLVYMAIFLVGNTWTALAGGFWALLLSRILTASVSGAIISLVLILAAQLAPREKRAGLVSWVFAGFSIASIIGIPIGLAIARHRTLSSTVIGIANVIQTIPSLAMLSIIMLGLGLGVNTVIVTVFLYSLLPIIKNTYTGMQNVDKNLMDAAKGMGMTRWQSLYMVEIPLSMSVIMAGIRNALVVAIGITAIGAFVGAGGLGDIIVRGTNATNGGAIILAGALPTALMAIISDLVLGFLERRLEPKGKAES